MARPKKADDEKLEKRLSVAFRLRDYEQLDLVCRSLGWDIGHYIRDATLERMHSELAQSLRNRRQPNATEQSGHAA